MQAGLISLNSWLCRLMLAMLLPLLGISAAMAQAPVAPVPELTGRVIDQSGTLSSSDVQSLTAQLKKLEDETGAQVVVLMVPTTAPEDIASYAWRVASSWKLGRKEIGDGTLIVVAKNDRRMRIEVARKLEGAIPDIMAARIIDGAMKPRFREGDFAGGLLAAVDQIDARIAGESLPAPQGPGQGRGGQMQDEGSLSDLAIFLFFGVMVAGPLLRRLLGQRLGGLAMGGGAGLLAFVVTSSLLLAAAAAVAALLYTWIFAGRNMPIVGHGGQHGGGRGGWGGGWGSGGSPGGGFGSSGGGDFGGGGASGDW